MSAFGIKQMSGLSKFPDKRRIMGSMQNLKRTIAANAALTNPLALQLST